METRLFVNLAIVLLVALDPGYVD